MGPIRLWGGWACLALLLLSACVEPARSQDASDDLEGRLAARENQVNELLGEQKACKAQKTKLDSLAEANAKLEASLKTAQRRTTSLETQLQAVKDAHEGGGGEASKAAQAEAAGLRAKLREAEGQLQDHQAKLQEAESGLEQAQGRVARLTADLDAAAAAQAKLVESSDLSSRSNKAALKKASDALAKAQADAAKATSALSLAQQDALGTLSALDDWFGASLPSWAGQQYGKVTAAAAPTVQSMSEVVKPYYDSAYKVVEPHASVAYKHGSQYGRAGYDAGSRYAQQAYKTGGEYASSAWTSSNAYGQQAYAYSHKRGREAWLAAHPHIGKALARLQAAWRQATAKLQAVLGPHLSSGSAGLERGLRSIRKQAHRLTAHPQLYQLRRNANSAWAELEALMQRGMTSMPHLKPWARKPYTTIALLAVLSVPFVMLAGPALLVLGAMGASKQSKPAAKQAQPAASATSQPRRKSKAKQFSDGGDTVEYR